MQSLHLCLININKRIFLFIEPHHYVTKEEEWRLKTQQNAEERQIKLVAADKGISSLLRYTFKNDEGLREVRAKAVSRSSKKGLIGQREPELEIKYKELVSQYLLNSIIPVFIAKMIL